MFRPRTHVFHDGVSYADGGVKSALTVSFYQSVVSTKMLIVVVAVVVVVVCVAKLAPPYSPGSRYLDYPNPSSGSTMPKNKDLFDTMSNTGGTRDLFPRNV